MLVSLELNNFCRYENIKAQFKPGMNAIIGPNGAGKSTLLVAAAGILTGRFDAFPGAKSDNIRCNCEETDKSWAKMGMRLKGGQTVEVTRLLQPIGQKLKVDKKTITKNDEIKKEISRWLGMEPATFVEFAFAFQWELRKIVDDTDTHRIDALHRLFKLDHIEDCRELLNKRLNKADTITVIDVAHVTGQRDAAVVRLADISTKLKSLVLPSVVTVEDARKLVSNFARRAQLEQQHLEVIKQLTVKRQDIEDGKAILARDQGELCNACHEVEHFAAENIAAQLQTWKQRRSLMAKKTADLDKLNQLLHERPAENKWLECDDDREREVIAALGHMSKFLETFDPSTGRAVCPTCETETSQLADRYTSYKDESNKLTAELGVLRTRKAAAKALQTWEDSCRTIQARIVNWDVSMPEAPTMDEASLMASAQLERASKTKKEQLTTSVSNSRVILANSEAAVRYLDAQLGKLENELSALPSDARCVESAKKLIENYEMSTAEKVRLEAQRDLLQENLKEYETALKNAEASKQLAEKTQVWRSRLAVIRDAFHRDNLPRALAQKRLKKLEAGVNQYLEELGVDFRIIVGDSLSFTAKFPDGRVIPAERLSGGEKVVFALAWRLTVNSVFSSEVGLLCLDEPTAGLDGERLECLKRALKRLKLLAGTHGLQCIIVTHERSLMPIFDNFIELK